MKIQGFIRSRKDGMISFEIPLFDGQSWCSSVEDPSKTAANWVCGVVFGLTGRKIKARGMMISKNEFEIETQSIKEILGVIVQQHRRKAGLSVRDLAKKAGLKSHTNIVHYEKGKSEMSLSKLEQILAPLGLVGLLTLSNR